MHKQFIQCNCDRRLIRLHSNVENAAQDRLAVRMLRLNPMDSSIFKLYLSFEHLLCITSYISRPGRNNHSDFEGLETR